MTVDEMLAGDWKLLIDEAPVHLAMTITFDAGVVRENGRDVGAYSVSGDRLTASIGDDMTVEASLPDLSPLLPHIEPVKPNSLSATATTRITDASGLPEIDDEDLVEPAVLTRVSHDRRATAAVRDRLHAIDGGKSLGALLQGEWDVTIDDQPTEQADRLSIDGEEAAWNGQPVPLKLQGDRAIIDLGASHYEVKRYYRDPSRADRFDANLVMGPGEIINGQMDRVLVGNTGPRTLMTSAG